MIDVVIAVMLQHDYMRQCYTVHTESTTYYQHHRQTEVSPLNCHYYFHNWCRSAYFSLHDTPNELFHVAGDPSVCTDFNSIYNVLENFPCCFFLVRCLQKKPYLSNNVGSYLEGTVSSHSYHIVCLHFKLRNGFV